MHAWLTMRAWPVARSIFDAPFDAPLGACERSERADNKLDKHGRLSHTASSSGLHLTRCLRMLRARRARRALIRSKILRATVHASMVSAPRKPSGQMANFANNGARELKIGQNDCFFHSSLAPHAPLWKHFTSEVIPEKLIFTPFGRR